jgi:hypothetical protein
MASSSTLGRATPVIAGAVSSATADNGNSSIAATHNPERSR